MADQRADLERARRRLTEASDAWLNAYESSGLTQTIVDEYYAAYQALVRLNDGGDNA